MPIVIFTAINIASADGPGTFDASFNGSGIVITSIGNISQGKAVALQPDGKIVVAGTSDGNFAVIRYNEDGTLDTTFNNTGIITTTIDNASSSANAVALQNDGKIVVAGTRGDFFDNGFTVARYTITGTLDTTLNGTGIVITSLDSGIAVARSIAIQSDGKIIVAGDGDSFGDGEFVVVRYHDDGNLDTTFNGSGIVTTPTDGVAFGNSVALQSDGRIIVAGSGLQDFVLARYNSNGNLDTTFNGNGIVTTHISNIATSGAVVAIQPDDKIVVAGNKIINFDFDSDLVVVRYDSNGNLDTNFNGTGMVTTPINSGDELLDMTIQPNGKIVAASMTRSFGNYDITVVRYNSDGTLDETFNGTGIVMTPLRSGNSFDKSNGVVIQNDHKIVVAGSSDDDIALVRYIGGAPQLTLSKLVNDNQPAIGQRVTYTLVVENQGEQDATQTVISDTLPAGLTFAGPVVLEGAEGIVAQSANDLPIIASGLAITAGTSVTVTLPVTVDVGLTDQTIITNTASVTSAEVTNPLSNTNVITVQAPHLSVAKNVNDETPYPGQKITYTLTISNNGHADATQATISDTLSPGLTFAGSVIVEPSGIQLPTPTTSIIVEGLTITAGQQIRLTYPVIVDADVSPDTMLTNQVQMSSFEVPAPLLSSKSITVRIVDLAIQKTTTNDTPSPNETITYTIVINNDGSTTATNALISDTLPPGLTFAGPVTVEPSGIQLPTPTSSILATGLTIAPGEAITLTYPILLDAGLEDGVILTNQASISSTEAALPFLASVSVTVTITTTEIPDFDIYLPIILKR